MSSPPASGRRGTRRAPSLPLALSRLLPLLLAGLAHGAGPAQGDEGLDADPDPPPSPDEPIAPPLGEGPLGNDAFLPVDADAAAAFEEGDRRLAEARAAATREAGQRSLRAAFEAWARVAGRLTDGGSAALDGVPAGAREAGNPRLVEGVASALARRIGWLRPEERAVWRRTFEPVAAVRPEGSDAAWPGTAVAARAALRSVDRALERGALGGAESALLRTRRLAALLDDETLREPLVQALGSRETALETWRSDGSKREDAKSNPSSTDHVTWRDATRLESRGSIQLLDRDLPVVPGQAGPGLGARPGLVALGPQLLAVQTPAAVWRVELGRDGAPRKATAAFLDQALAVAAGPFARPRVGRDEGGWPLRPLALDGDLVLVHGTRGGGQEGVPNVLARFPPPPLETPRRGGLLVERPPGLGGGWLPRWALSGSVLWRPGNEPGGTVERVEALRDLPELEWQPGPVLVDGLLVAQARGLRDRTEAWLVGLEPADGRVRWTRRLGAGVGLPAVQGRFAAAAVPRVAAPPLLAAGGLVLAATQLGFQSLVDPADGTLLWTLATRRRQGSEAGWSLPGPFVGTPDAQGTPLALLAPVDSDRLYPLALGPLEGPGKVDAGATALLPLARPIQRQRDAEALLGAAGRLPLVLRRDGRERTLALLGAPGQAPLDAFHLGPEETFRGAALASPERVLAASDRAVYLLDATRELLLLDVEPLERRGELPGGDVHAAGPWVVVLGFDALWVLAPRR